MATFFLSSNPTIPNFSIDLLSPDFFVNDTGAASRLNVFQSGSDTIITNGTNTARLQNFAVGQIANAQFTSNDGSLIQIGDGTVNIAADGAANGFGGTNGGDLFLGFGGNDVVTASTGNDLLYGNQGDDSFTSGVNGGQATVFGGQGNDTMNFAGYTGASSLFGNLGDDIITGGATTSGNNTVFGGQGNDVINFGGATGNNVLFGDLGNDIITGGASASTVFGGQGQDTINGGAAGSLLLGNIGDDVINGGVGNDTLFGGQGQDALFGGSGNDRLFGDLGNDTINGFIGSDTLTGGAGNDVFIEDFAAPFDAGTTSATADYITDFVSGADTVRFTNATAGAVGDGANATGNFTSFGLAAVNSVEAAVTAYANSNLPRTNYTFIQGASNGYLVFDANTADAAATGVIVIQGTGGLTATDIFQQS